MGGEVARVSRKDRQRALWCAAMTASIPKAVEVTEDTTEAVLEACHMADVALDEYGKRFGGAAYGNGQGVRHG